MYKLRVDKAIFERFPEYVAKVIYAYGLTNGASDEYAKGILSAAERKAQENFVDKKPADDPHILAWRTTYSAFGSKPSKYSCSVEALLSRVLKGQSLPNINRVVDIYNAVSIKYNLPAGGEDLDKLTGDLVLKFADGSEPFVNIQNGEEIVSYPDKGEVIWADPGGVTCRRWNWRQCLRTALVKETRNAYFVLDCLPPSMVQNLEQATEELIGHIKAISPEANIEFETFSQSNLAIQCGV